MSLVSRLPRILKKIMPASPAEKVRAGEISAEKVFSETIETLLKPKIWTFGAFRFYNEKMLEILGGTGFKGYLQKNQKNPVLDQTRLKIKILEAMTPFEISSNHKSVFTETSIAQIAQVSGARPADVREVIDEHDILRADRRWYQIRQQFRRALPRSVEEKEFLAKRDRPLSETEKEGNKAQRERQVELVKKRKNYTPPPRRPHAQFTPQSELAEKWSLKSVRVPGTWPFGRS